MFHRLAVSLVAVTFALGVPAVALASSSHDWDDDDDGHHGAHHAPEPFTMIGLGLGAAGIIGARWAYRRRTSRKP
jgi:hypothetical protein